MKRNVMLSFLMLLLIGCKPPDVEDSHEFMKKVQGNYRLIEATIDKPLDLDFDGTAHTDLLQELTCYEWGSLKSARPLQLYWNDYYQFNSIFVNFDVIYSVYDNVYSRLLEPGCYTVVTFGLSLHVDNQTKTIAIQKTDNAEYENFGIVNEQSYGHLDSVRWSNNCLYTFWTKQFPTSATDQPKDYSEVTMQLTYERLPD